MTPYQRQQEIVAENMRRAYEQTELIKALEPDLVKGKKANIGEIREWQGKKFQKTTDGWHFIKEEAKGAEKETEKKEEQKKEDNFSFNERKIEIEKILKDFLPDFSYIHRNDENGIVLKDSKYGTSFIEVAPANRYWGIEDADKKLYVHFFNKKEISSTSLADPKAAYQTTSARIVKHKTTKKTKEISSLKDFEKLIRDFKKIIS